jgi:drug/metabolite transporter (DMT)-like permease
VPERSTRERTLSLLAFASIWFVWGSTFFAIRVAIGGIPPVLMCGLRLLSAGLALLLWARLTGVAWPRGIEWRNAALVGVLLPGIGNVSVTIGVAHVHSGLVALLVSTIPLWMALLAAFGPEAQPPGRQALLGLVLGFAGIALLIGPGLLTGHDATLSPFWALVPVLGSLSWSWGSLWSRRARLPRSPMMSTAVGLVAAGVAALLVALALGDLQRWNAAATSPGAWWALAYLAAFGSVLGFSAYLYLLRHHPPSVVATYAFVNPIVAMFLGFLFGGESLSPRTLAAAAVVLAAVLLITTAAPAVRREGLASGLGTMPARRP